MNEPDDVTGASAPESPRAPASESVPVPEPSATRRALVPYLVVAALGLLAALIVLVQLWAYRDELRTILTQTPV